jgi:hypothetical protein
MLTAFVKGKNLFWRDTDWRGLSRVHTARERFEIWTKRGVSSRRRPNDAPARRGNQVRHSSINDISSLVGERQTKPSKKRLAKFGLLNKDFSLKKQDLFISDPYKWAVEFVLPKMKAAGMDIDANATQEQKTKP